MVRKLDQKQFGLSLKPINMEIIHYIQKHDSATTKALIEHLKAFSQASIYRAIKELLDSELIAIEKEVKVHSVLERYFKLNDDFMATFQTEPTQAQYDDIVNMVNIWMSTLTKEIQDYLTEWSQSDEDIRVGMARELLYVSDENLVAFFKELYALIQKYQALPTKGDEKNFAFSASWVPIKERMKKE